MTCSDCAKGYRVAWGRHYGINISGEILDLGACPDKTRPGDEIDRLRAEVERWTNNADNLAVQVADLKAENAALKEKYEGQRPKCHSGHENILPLALWDCPMCSDERRKELREVTDEVRGDR